MTDKQQIENMAQILFDALDNAVIFEQITITGGRVKTDCYALAEALYNTNYRKVPENAVVLTKEEFWKLSNKFSKKELDEIVDFHKNKTRKEMAKEILKWLVDTGVINTAPDTIKMYFKERFGVEVE